MESERYPSSSAKDKICKLSFDDASAMRTRDVASGKLRLSEAGYNSLSLIIAPAFTQRLTGIIMSSESFDPNHKLVEILNEINSLELNSGGRVNFDSRIAQADISLNSGIGNIEISGDWQGSDHGEMFSLSVSTE